MKRFNQKLIGILSCLIFLAALPVFAQSGINKKPLEDFAANLNSKLETKEVDLTKPFSVTLEGSLTFQGKLDPNQSRFTKTEGDEKMVEVAKSAIESINETGALSYLSNAGVEKVTINLMQDETNVLMVVDSELANFFKAKVVGSGLNLMLVMARGNVDSEPEKTLLNAANVSTQNKNCLINFLLQKEEAHRLLKNELQKAKEKSYSSKVN